MSSKFRAIRAEHGFTLIEAVVATSIFVVGVVGLIQLTLFSNMATNEARDTVQASNYLQEGVEAVRGIRDAAWTNLPIAGTYRLTNQAGLTPAWTLGAGTETIGKFSRTVTMADVRRDDTNGDGSLSAGDQIVVTGGAFDDPETKRVTVTVTWQQGSRTINRQLYTYVTRWRS